MRAHAQCGPKLPYGLMNEETGRGTYLTHRLSAQGTPRCHPCPASPEVAEFTSIEASGRYEARPRIAARSSEVPDPLGPRGLAPPESAGRRACLTPDVSVPSARCRPRDRNASANRARC